jgi:hypothetical protein
MKDAGHKDSPNVLFNFYVKICQHTAAQNPATGIPSIGHVQVGPPQEAEYVFVSAAQTTGLHEPVSEKEQ